MKSSGEAIDALILSINKNAHLRLESRGDRSARLGMTSVGCFENVLKLGSMR